MARTEIPIIVLHPETGEYVEDAEVTVTFAAGGAATVYDAATGSTPVTQPLLSDAQGRVTGWLDRGAYNLTISVSGFPDIVENYHSSPAANGDIDTDWIANNAVTNSKLAADAVTNAKILNDAVTASKIQADAVGASEIAAGAVGTSELASKAVDSTKLKDDAATDANRAVTTNHVRDSAITNAKLASNAVTGPKITANTIDYSKLAQFPATRVTRSTTQTIADSTDTAIIWDTTLYQKGGTLWDSGTPSRVAFPQSGVYLVTAGVQWDSNATGIRRLRIRFNGSSLLAGSSQALVQGSSEQTLSTVHHFTAGGYVELMAFQTSTASRTVSSVSQYSPIMTVTWLASM